MSWTLEAEGASGRAACVAPGPGADASERASSPGSLRSMGESGRVERPGPSACFAALVARFRSLLSRRFAAAIARDAGIQCAER